MPRDWNFSIIALSIWSFELLIFTLVKKNSRRIMRGIFSVLVLFHVVSTASSMCTPLPAYLNLRGGGWFPKFGSHNDVVAEPPRVEAKGSTGQSAATQQQQDSPSLIGHAFEYALAGSLDGIRSGFGQGVGAVNFMFVLRSKTPIDQVCTLQIAGKEFEYLVQHSFAGIGSLARNLAFARILSMIPRGNTNEVGVQ